MADTTSGEPDFATSIAAVIKEESAGGAACGWRSCTGCHETNEGAETGYYPYSKIFGCYVGSGCSECGGLGVVWEYYSKQDLDKMQRETTRPLTNELLAAALTRLASAEAFTMPRGINRPADDELVARMDFARAILAGSETEWPAEADTALKAALKYLRGQAPDVVSGSQRNGELRSRIKWVLLGCGGPLRSDVDGSKPLVTDGETATPPAAPVVEALPPTREYVDRIVRIFRDRPDDDSSFVVLHDYARAALATKDGRS